MLQFRAVHKSRPGLTLRDVDLTLEPGSALLVSGATGSGKSTLLQLTYGGLLADAGSVEVFGRDIARLRKSSLALMRRHIGIVPQTLELLEMRTVSDNVAMPLDIRALDRKQIRTRVAEVLEWVGMVGMVGMAAMGQRLVADLSLGQRQLVAIARALVAMPDLVVADEPTAYLDNQARERVIDAMAQAVAHGATAFIATNDHKLLSAGARLGWSHAEVADGTVQFIAERGSLAASAPELAPESAGSASDIIESAAPGVVMDVNEPDGSYYEEYSCEPGQASGGDSNVVPFPLRIAYAGGLVK